MLPNLVWFVRRFCFQRIELWLMQFFLAVKGNGKLHFNVTNWELWASWNWSCSEWIFCHPFIWYELLLASMEVPFIYWIDLEEERILSPCYNLLCGISLMYVVCFLIVLGSVRNHDPLSGWSCSRKFWLIHLHWKLN